MFPRRTARIAALFAAALVASAAFGCVRTRPVDSLARASIAGSRLLVIAPHPDDETLATGGAIDTAIRRGVHVTVVFVTCGDGFLQAVRSTANPHPTPADMQAFGARRAQEARRATAALGVAPADVVFLGFPDAATKILWTTNFDADQPLLGPNGASAVPYPFAFQPHAPYTGAELLGELEDIVRTVKPTTVIYPDGGDANRDHWAVAAFSQAALLASDFSGRSYTYLVHRPGFPATAGSDSANALTPPADLADTGTAWASLPLSEATVDVKERAYGQYASQIAADKRLVSQFVRGNELFAAQTVPTLAATGTVLPAVGAGMPKVTTPPSAKVRAFELRPERGGITVGLRTDAPVSPAVNYLLHARAILPDGRLRFWDASVKGGRLTPMRLSELEVAGGRIAPRSSADSLRVTLPLALTDGARWLLVSADTSAPAGTLYDHVPVRAVRLTP